jgi:hypothetical protein
MMLRLLLLLPTLAGTLGTPPASGGLPEVERHTKARGYFMAGSAVVDRDALGGFASSSNYPHPIGRQVPPGEVSLIALPDELSPFEGSHRGFLVVLANATAETVSFSASDSRLSIVREAVDPDGAWKPIEYLPSSWCGNSYHCVFLPAGEAWRFTAPTYRGTIATRMRFVLRREKGASIYSNEFPGSINPGQFSTKEGHTPLGIMDPNKD